MNALIQKINASLLNLIGATVERLPAIITAIIILMLTRYVANLVKQLATQVGERALHNQSLQILLIKTSYVSAWVIGIVMACVMAFPTLRLGDVVAALGLGSVAIGFAFQDIFKNFLAGILLLLQQPFRITDQVIIDKYEGTVEKIDLRFTQIRTYKGERVLLPNATVFTSPVQVRTAYGHRRTDLELGVDYNTSLPNAAKILYETVTGVEGVLSEPAPEVDLIRFGDSSIDFIVRYWTLPQQQYVRRAQTRVIIAIKKAFDQANINIPYPIRNLYFNDQERLNDYFVASKDGNANQ